MLKHKFTARWVGNIGERRPAYWIHGTRVSVDVGYQFANENNIELSERFHNWHRGN